MMTLRALATVVALALLGAAAHVNILAGGGYGTAHAHAVITLAVAAGVAVGALAIGAAWGQRRRTLALAILVALLAGEAFALISTAERLIAAREAVQAPLRAHLQIVDKARHRVARAEASLATAPTTSPRLEAALAAKAAADRAVVEKAAEKGCAANCRALLEQQVAAAGTELAAARAEIEKARTMAEAELVAARTALAALPAPASASPLADRLGVPAWALDLLTAALGSIAANGLGGLLLAFAGHGQHQRPLLHWPMPAPEPLPQTASTSVAPMQLTGPKIGTTPVDPPREHASGPVSAFAVASLYPVADSAVPLADVYKAYREWCADSGRLPLDPGTFADEFAGLVKRLRLGVQMSDTGPLILGASVVRPKSTSAAA